DSGSAGETGSWTQDTIQHHPQRNLAHNMTYIPAPFRITTQNCRGLNTAERRSHLLRELAREQVSIAMLQETHFKSTDTHRLKSRHYPVNYHSTHPTTRKVGVAILLNANLQFKLTDQLSDPSGRFLFIKGTILQKTYTLASVYAPNAKQATFLRKTISQLATFTEGTLLIGGDFNAPLDPLSDSSTGHSSIPQTAIRTIRKSLRDLRLVDAWRALHPTDRDYTHYSSIHRRYSRIDYLLIQQEGLQRLQKAEIHTTTWSDHSAVTMLLDSPMFKPAQTAWRMNESLLSDLEVQTQLAEHLTNYFNENNTGDISQVTLWEAHKTVLRGHFIRIASRKKKEAQQRLNELTNRIAQLETLHKRTQLETQYRSLLEARNQLTELVARRHHRATQRNRAFYYIHANKSGRLLAHMIKNRQARAQVHELRTTKGTLTQFPEEIAEEFRKYYQTLYNIDPTTSGDRQDDRIVATTQYLQNFRPEALSLEE
ncbi:Hypothetical predicted protein, partial [Pelobates cultripes]